MMRLLVHVPGEVVVDQPAIRIEAEGPHGFFTLLPNHIDMVTALQPGLLRHVTPEGAEHFLGVDEGILVKCGADVRVALRGAITSETLEGLREAVTGQFLALDDNEQAARGALARLETGAIRALIEIDR